MQYFIGARSYDFYLDNDGLRNIRNLHRRLKAEGKMVKQLDTRSAIVNTEETPALLSYLTVVCVIRDGKLVRLWDDWSATTSKHVKAFCNYYGLKAPNKAEWLAMPIGG